MDVQRIILIGALCLISYMLVLQWNQDYGQQPQAEQVTTSVSAYETPASVSDLPAATEESAQAGDLPATAVQAKKASLVEVKTDVLNVTIDTKGGDIIQVSLPEYKALLGSNLPFVLLEQTPERTYVSQSGLVGKNGPDGSASGRPTYAITQSEFTLGDQDALSVDLTYTADNNVQITKRYTFNKGSYEIGLEFIVNNQSQESWSANLFGQIKRDQSPDPTSTTDMGMQSYLGPVFSTQESNYTKYDFDSHDQACHQVINHKVCVR